MLRESHRDDGFRDFGSISIMRLQRAMIFVKDLDRMAAFYGETLGLEAMDATRTEAWAEFDGGGASLALHAVPSHVAEGIEITSPPRAREENPVKLVFVVDDVECERARLAALGVPMIARPWGACDGIDPEGNVFQICPARPR
jgi:catechol 2,3-dioxygenase-like lactoylglutathione lyase family enzyme